MDLDGLAQEIYQLPPSEFTAARDSKIAQGLSSGDKTLAKEIKGLKKPTVAAWVLNLLARQRREELRGVVELGSMLRQAQEDLAGEELRRLSRRRPSLIGALTDEAVTLAAGAAQNLSETVRREVAESLEAALVDRRAAEMILSGRVARAPRLAEFETADLGRASPSGTTLGKGRAGRPAAAGEGRRRPSEADARVAKRLIETKRQERERAERELERVQEKLGKAAQELERLRAAEQAARHRLHETQVEERAARGLPAR